MSRAVTATALSAFLAADIFLAVVAVAHVRQDPPPSNLGAAANEATLDTATQRAFEFDPGSASVLSVANDGTLIMGTRGDCDAKPVRPGQVSISSDGGKALSPTSAGVRHVLAAQASNGGKAKVVGLNTSCKIVQVSTANGGRKWTDDSKPTLWFMSPEDPYVVVTPEGSTKPGCTVTSLTQLGKRFGRVTCADGTIRGTGNGGDEWVTLGRLDNVRVATFTSVSNGYALARFAGCAAQVFVTDDSGRSWERRSCLPGDPARSLAASDTDLIALVGQSPQLFTSIDRGGSFAAPN